MNVTKPFLIIGLIIAAVVAVLSLFTVHETQKAIILRLGQMQTEADGQVRVLGPGLHFKVPFVDTVRYFDRRIQSLDISSSRTPTSEKKELIIDLFAKWRVEDFSTFFKATGGNRLRAEMLLREKIVDSLRAEVGRRSLNNVVSEERELVMQKVRDEASTAAMPLGIRVLDARMIRIDLPDEVSEAVYGLMITERKRIAGEQRARGRSRAEAIRAQADARVEVLIAQADKESNRLRGEGDAKAAAIYAKAYGQDPEFYRFYRSLEAYRETFKDKSDMLVIKPDNEFFKYFHHIQGSDRQEGKKEG